MLIRQADFVKSSSSLQGCPPENLPEFAFIGRSNVGKSSLINMIVGVKNLAKTSSTPGKTRLINHFLINGEWFLVDLPGYGYARISKKEKAAWQKMIDEYLLKRTQLLYTFVLIDARLDPQQKDIDFINYLGEHFIPIVIILTKCDKVSRNEAVSSAAKVKRKLSETWGELPLFFLSSSKTADGKDELLRFISNGIKDFRE